MGIAEKKSGKRLTCKLDCSEIFEPTWHPLEAPKIAFFI